MREKTPTAWLSRLLQSSVRGGLRQAYFRVQLNPKKYLRHVRRAYGLPIKSWHDVHSLDESLLNRTAARVVRSSARTAALEGMGLGIGGITTLVPDMGILSAITIRMLQKLSLIYGFEYSTDDEIAALWVAAASAAGLDLTREFLEKQAVERVVPRIVDQVAVKLGAEVAEKWAARVVPILSAAAAASLNYYFVRSWGRRAQQHFLERRRGLAVPALAPRVVQLPSPRHAH
ncbi:MAG: EcsC family protein [Candidatus Acidiferrales bacterium]